MLAGRPPFGFLGLFQLCCFSFGVSCLLAWLGQPLIFLFATSICGLVFPCHRHLCTVFSVVGLRVRLLSLPCYRLFQGISVPLNFWYHAVRLLLVSWAWRFELEIFPGRLPCGHPYKFHFEANPIWYSIKFTKLHSAKCSLHKWVWLMKRSINVSSFQLYKCDPFLPHSSWFRGNSYIAMLWVGCWLLQLAETQ